MNKTLKISIFFIFLLLLQNSVSSCTIFSADDGNQTLAGNNGDYSDPDTYIVFYPAEAGKFGRVYCGWKQFWWQTGMNDQGLFFGSASTSFLEVYNSSTKPHYPGYLMYKCMEECATVEEVIEVFDQYNLDFLETMQLLVSDANGASVIIEGDSILVKQDYYQVVTNFRLSQTDPPYPCWRYNTAVEMFESTNTITVDFFSSICNATHQEGQYPSQFSTVYDLKEKIINLYCHYNYNQVKVFNLTTELEFGYHMYLISSLFNSSNPPTKPAKPTGTNFGTIGKEYKYDSISTDIDQDKIYYLFDWGDGTNSGWLGPYESGQKCSASHIWTEKNGYQIKVKAKDINGLESPWSEPRYVTMPHLKTSFVFHSFNLLEFIIYKILTLINVLYNRL